MQSHDIGGYHQTLLVDHPEVICTLCFKFPRSPLQCCVCKSVYCASEITPLSFECLVCANRTVEDLESATYSAYLSTLMFCPMCSSVMKFQNYQNHACFLVPCWNSEVCGKKSLKGGRLEEKGVCSPACLLVRMKKEGRGDREVLGAVGEMVRRFEFRGKK